MRSPTAIMALAIIAAPGAALAFEAGELVGKWGLAAYFEDKDAGQTEAAAHAQCHAPYVIARGRTGGVMLHLPDERKTTEMQVKASLGTVYIGPPGEAGGKADRQVLRFDGRTLVLKWLDPEVAHRYGIMVFVRCGK